MSTFGDIERLFADLYPYRWGIGAGVLVFIAAVMAFGYWKGWHLAIWGHRLQVSVVAVPVLAVTIWLGWSLGSPLFTNVTVEEEFPFAFNAVVPPDMERVEVEEIMAGLAKVRQEFNEEMPSSPPDFKPVQAGSSRASETGTAGKVVVMDEADHAMLTKGVALVLKAGKEAMEKSDVVMMDEGLGMIAAAVDTIKPSPETADPRLNSGPGVQGEVKQPGNKSPGQVSAVALSSGNFMDFDSFHRGSGEATIYRGPDGSHVLRFEDLDVTNGPDLRVILTPFANPEVPRDFKVSGYIELGRLKGNRGNQNYLIPNDVDVSIYRSVIIYCKPFSVIFSVASLQVLSQGDSQCPTSQ